MEFDCIEDLRTFDSEFLVNVDSEIITHICITLQCEPNDITDIAVISAGLTNVSFSFSVNGISYVYRHPGGNSGNLVDRKSELFIQMVARDIGIDRSVITMDLSGWKLSYYVPDAKTCDFTANPAHLGTGMEYLHRLHAVKSDGSLRVFDNVAEGKKLMRIASATKGNLQREFSELLEKVDRLYAYVKQDAARLGYGLVPCHNDVYEPNFLYDRDGNVYLIDWEYAGMQDPHVDIAMFCIYSLYDRKEIDKLIDIYFEGNCSRNVRIKIYCYIAACGLLWSNWCEYKRNLGVEFGEYSLRQYRYAKDYYKIVMEELSNESR